ncbi:hypothetical protein AVEN_100375-1 [Araneus ventricosus]|uniref:PiggyBac transposable element-derived protein domain-containing protein n=1 Tax=Araneus ventricosus TaxID=182803 RepID=A0A4Y2L7Z3_ARAVE|nr:hypothetical protein AVEN_100375-1 [Araneus ventricosus]
MTPSVLPFVSHTNYFERLITSVRCCPFRIEVFTCCSQCPLHTKKKWNVLAEVETDEDSDNGPEDVSEEIFLDHESFCEPYTESEEKGDSGNDSMNNLNCFQKKEGTEWSKTKCRQNIHCHNNVSRLPGKEGPSKDVTSPVKSWELFINDNMILLIVE